MKIKKILKPIFLFFIIISISFSSQLNAANDLRSKLDNLDGDNTHIKTIVKNGGINTDKSLTSLVSSVIKLVLGLFGVIALIFVIRAGAMWMGSKGDSNKIREARKIMTSGFIGLAIIVLSYSVTDFAIKQISLTIGNGELPPDYVGGGESGDGNCTPSCNPNVTWDGAKMIGGSNSAVCDNNSESGGILYASSDDTCGGKAIKTWDCVCEGIHSVPCYVCAP
ncbi:MAG: hypothetical protein QMB51_01560 [Patescibacteria group bacterium]